MTQQTPTINTALELRPGGFSDLCQALDYAAQGETGINFYDGFGKLQQALSYRQLRDEARTCGRRLRSLGFDRGDKLALIAETSPAFVTLFYACQYAGLVPCPLPFTVYPGGRAAYVAQLTSMLSVAGVRGAVTPSSMRDCLEEAVRTLDTNVWTFDEVFLATREGPLEPLGDEELAYVQFSSGSTSQPKGVLISQRGLSTHVQSILRDGMRMRAGDRAFSWLPFYHDMGLVGFSIAAMCAQCSVDYLSPSSFSKRPTLWLELMSNNRSTITYSPDFGYRLVLQRLKNSEHLDLSCLRIAGIGGDMIRPAILREFADRLASSGFRFNAFLPSYGMAEATLAIAVGDPDAPLSLDRLGDGLERLFVVCGRPLPGTDVRVVDDLGNPLDERHVGNLLVSGPGLMTGYLGNDLQCGRTLEAGEFFPTGDLGYLLDGQVVVTGRTKDMILIRGRNIWPQDIEWALERIAPLAPDDVAAFSVESEEEERLVVLVQTRLTEITALNALQQRLANAISQGFGMSGKIVFVSPRSLPFTSSGKLSRSNAKARYLNGYYSPARHEI